MLGRIFGQTMSFLLLGLAEASAISTQQMHSKLSACSAACVASSLDMASCLSAQDIACFCSDKGFQSGLQTCLFEHCEPADAIVGAQIQAEACHGHVRSRKQHLLSALAAEIPAFLSPWLRLYSRWKTRHEFAVDDYLMLACGILFTVFIVLGQLVSFLAFGRDVWQVKESYITFSLKVFYIDESLYLLCLGLTKISVLSFYLRLFPHESFRYVAQATAIFVAASTVLFTFLQVFQCSPIGFIWEGWKNPEQNHRCLEMDALTYAAAGTSITQDIIILVLPLPFLAKLNTCLKTKLGIMFMFSLGILVLVTSVVRLYYFVGFGSSQNPTWDYTDALIWTGLEVSMSIIVACLPAIRALFRGLKHDNARLAATWPETVSGSSHNWLTRWRRARLSERPQRSLPPQLPGIEGLGRISNSLELSLELGDRIQGEVQTEILAINDPISCLDAKEMAGDDGIYVTTTTTSTVELNQDRSSEE